MTLNSLHDLFQDLIEYRDRLLRSVGREESVQDRQELAERLIESISDSTEVLIGEVLERYLRDEFGLTPDPSEDRNDSDDQ
jgi:hypothetical protein